MALAIGDQRRKREAMDALVADLSKGSDENVTNLLRLAIERGWKKNMMESLSEAKKKKDSELDRICAKHYVDFLVSVKELIAMKGSAAQLTDLVNEINSEFHTTGEDLLTALNDLESIQIERENARKILEDTLACNEIAKSMLKTKQLIDQNDHYGAMELLDKLRQQQSKVTVLSMRTCLLGWLPMATSRLIEAVHNESAQVIFEIREKSETVGSTILRRKAQELTRAFQTNFSLLSSTNSTTNLLAAQGRDTPISSAFQQTYSKITNCPPSLSLQFISRLSPELKINKWTITNELDAVIPQHFVDPPPKGGVSYISSLPSLLSSLHRSLHVHRTLGLHSHFEVEYRDERDPWLALLFEECEEMINCHGLPSVLPSLSSRICGFFSIECLLRQTCFDVHHAPSTDPFSQLASQNAGHGGFGSPLSQGIFSEMELLSLWSRACAFLQALIKRQCFRVKSVEMMLLIKEELLLLAETMADDQAFGISFPPEGVHEAMRALWGRFEKLELRQVQFVCSKSLEVSAFQPFYVSKEEDFNSLIRPYRLDFMGMSESEELLTPPPSKKSDPDQRAPSRPVSVSGLGLGVGTRIGGELPPVGSGGGGAGRGTSSLGPSSSKSLAAASANLDALEEVLEGGSLRRGSKTSGKSSTSMFDKYNFDRDEEEEDDAEEEEGEEVNRKLEKTRTSSTSFRVSNPSPVPPPPPAMPSSYSLSKFKPQAYPFSEAVPSILRALHHTIIRFFVFCSKSPQLGMRGSAICMCVQRAFEVTLCSALLKDLRRDGLETPLSKACQISIDALSFSKGSGVVWQVLENGLTSFQWSEVVETHLRPAILKSRVALNNLATQAHDLIFEILSHKIGDLLESLVFIDLVPQVVPRTPHDSIESLIDFLQVTLMYLTHLPKPTRDAAHFTCCSKVAAGLLGFLLGGQTPQINVLGLVGLHLDCKRLEQFADSCGVDSLRVCFGEVHDLVSALMATDLPQIVQLGESGSGQETRRNRFPRLDLSKMLILIEKLVPLNPSISTSNLPRLDKATLKSLAKSLRNQCR